MKTALYNILLSDSALTAMLPGGIHISSEISREEAPAAFDANRELLACALIKVETTVPRMREIGAERTFVVIYFYQRTGSDRIDAARDRVYALLNDTRLGLAGRLSWAVEHSEDIADRHDPALLCSMSMSRYRVTAGRF